MSESEKLSLWVHDTSYGSVANLGPMLAANAINCTRAILVSTRKDDGPLHHTYTPAEFAALVASGAITRGHMTGAALFIDAQPVYDSGRVLHTIRTEAALQIARQAIEQFGKVLRHLVVVCDEKEMAAIKVALEPEVAAC